MSDHGELTKLVLRWQQLQEELQNVSPEEICRDCPEMLPEVRRRIQLLQQVQRTLTLDAPEPGPQAPAPPMSVGDAETVDPPPESVGDVGEIGEQKDDDSEPFGSMSQVHGYRIVGELGRGAMGVVYEAIQPELKRTVALKMILAGGHASSSQLQRFRTEAEAVARLKHSNVVQIYEIGEHEGLPFFSLELCSGGSLAGKLDGTPWQDHDAAELMEILAQGVHAAHEAGIVHRDLKPHNVLLDGDGTPKITDFGLAKKLDDTEGVTKTESVMGTPSYMAPEQARGETKNVGPSADVYALGAILYQLLTGRPPFKATSAWDTIAQVIHDEPVPPRQLNSKVSKDLETICLKCLEKEPFKQYDSAEALADDLGRFQRNEAIHARSITRAERAWRWCCRNPLVASLILSVLIVMLAGLSVSTVFYLREKRKADENLRLAQEKGSLAEKEKKAKEEETKAKQQEEKARKEAEKLAQANKNLAEKEREAKEAEKKARKKAEFVAYASKIDFARQAVHRRDFERARSLLSLTDSALQNWEHDFVFRQTLPKRNLSGHKAAVKSVVFSPDGKRIVSGSFDDHSATVIVWDVAIGKEVLTHTNPVRNPSCLALSPNGKRIIVAIPAFDPDTRTYWGRMRVWDTETGKELLTVKGHQYGVKCMAFSPNGKLIVSGGEDKLVKVWNASTGEETFTFTGHTERIASVALSPDGRNVVSVAKSTQVWDMHSGKELLVLKDTSGPVAFSPDGYRIATTTSRAGVKVWDISTGQEVVRHQGGIWDRAASCIAFSPDGEHIVIGSSSKLKVWDSAKLEPPLILRGHTSDIASVTFSPDNRCVVSGSDDLTVKVWHAKADSGALTLRGHRQNILSVAFSPDGKCIASGDGQYLGEPGKIKLWDATSGNEILTLQGHEAEVYSVAFNPNGKRIVSGSGDNTVRIWDLTTGKESLLLKGHRGDVYAVVFSPDGKCVVSGSNDDTVVIWDAATGAPFHILKGHSEGVTGVAISPCGRRIASGDKKGGLKVWDVGSGKQLLTIQTHSKMITCTAFSPDGRWIICGSPGLEVANRSGEAKVWETTTGENILTLKGHMAPVWSIAFSPDGKRIVSGSLDETIKVWDTATGQEALTLRGHAADVSSVAFSPDGRQILSGSADDTIKIWDSTIGAEQLTLRGHTSSTYSVAFSPDGKRIISGSPDRTVRVWDAINGNEIFILEGHTGSVVSIAVSPDGKYIASAGRRESPSNSKEWGGVRIWETATGKEVRRLGHTRVWSVAFSPDGKCIVAGNKVWDLSTGKEVFTLKGHDSNIRCVTFSPDGKRIASTDGVVVMWDANTGKEILALNRKDGQGSGSGDLYCLAFSPDGKSIVTGSGRLSFLASRRPGTVELWNSETGEKLLALQGHTDGVTSVAFSPDGKRIVSGSLDNTVKVWDVRTGQVIATLRGHTDGINSVVFSADGKRIVSGSDDGTVKVWDAMNK